MRKKTVHLAIITNCNFTPSPKLSFYSQSDQSDISACVPQEFNRAFLFFCAGELLNAELLNSLPSASPVTLPSHVSDWTWR